MRKLLEMQYIIIDKLKSMKVGDGGTSSDLASNKSDHEQLLFSQGSGIENRLDNAFEDKKVGAFVHRDTLASHRVLTN